MTIEIKSYLRAGEGLWRPFASNGAMGTDDLLSAFESPMGFICSTRL